MATLLEPQGVHLNDSSQLQNTELWLKLLEVALMIWQKDAGRIHVTKPTSQHIFRVNTTCSERSYFPSRNSHHFWKLVEIEDLHWKKSLLNQLTNWAPDSYAWWIYRRATVEHSWRWRQPRISSPASCNLRLTLSMVHLHRTIWKQVAMHQSLQPPKNIY